jgi:glycosyltransferase involved in cell wall biosynthesis
MLTANEVNYSIIVCTYNPDERLLKRCLSAIADMKMIENTAEVILVDNNSQTPIKALDYAIEFLKNINTAKIIEEQRQGLSYARMAGLKASKGKWVIFFDDDNEPEADYISTLNELHYRYPHVAAWGPGIVDVDFIDGVNEELKGFATIAFQYRNENQTIYSNQPSWQSCYPFGTGLSIRRSYCENYFSLLEKGIFSLADRKGDALSSGGDTQMVLFCISNGVAAGVSPCLKLVHMVPGKRTSFSYLKKLTFGTSVCYSTCIVEVFPGQLFELQRRLVSERKFIWKALKKWALLIFNSKSRRVFKLIEFLGSVAGDYYACGRPLPRTVVWILKRLNVM